MANTSYSSFAEIETVVRGFESCRIQPSQFNHRAHLTVALWYLSQGELPQQAAIRMRVSLQRFLNHHNIKGYNETMTLFWMRLLRRSHAGFETTTLTL